MYQRVSLRTIWFDSLYKDVLPFDLDSRRDPQKYMGGGILKGAALRAPYTSRSRLAINSWNYLQWIDFVDKPHNSPDKIPWSLQFHLINLQ